MDKKFVEPEIKTVKLSAADVIITASGDTYTRESDGCGSFDDGVPA